MAHPQRMAMGCLLSTLGNKINIANLPNKGRKEFCRNSLLFVPAAAEAVGCLDDW